MAFITGTHVPRRTLLKGLGATVALPFLDVFLNESGTALASTGAPIPVRFGTWYWGLGHTPGHAIAYWGQDPLVGSAVTTGIAFLLTVTTGDPVAIIVMFAFTAIFNVVQGSVIQPLVFSRAVNIHPAIVLLAIPAGGTLGGILGMFLVVPFIGVVAATWRTVLVVLGQPPAPGAVGEGGEAPALTEDAPAVEPVEGGSPA